VRYASLQNMHLWHTHSDSSEITLLARRASLTLALAIAFGGIGCAGSLTLIPEQGFLQPLGKNHPLAGSMYAVAERKFVSDSDLDDAAELAQFLVIGETHDNLDHHALEAQLVDAFLSAHASAAVGFEMLDEDVRTVLQNPPSDPDAFARAVKWEASGWPEFSQYRPVFAVALGHPARVIAAHPSRAKVQASLSAVPEDEARALRLDQPLSAAARTQLRDEIRESHCGHAPPAMLDAMERAQSYKDAFMARSVFEARVPVVLVTGVGHARNDRAVPHYLRALGAENVTSVALIEVDDARTTPDAYDIAAFDFVVFTPRVSDEDPCTRFKEELRKMSESAHPSEPKDAPGPAP
jgi:uncharacterized iron-regulated protein